MARRRPTAKPPTVDARQGIVLLERLIQRAEELKQQAIGQTEVQAWDAQARGFLERAFGTDSPNVEAVINATGDGGLYMGMPEKEQIAYWQSEIHNKTKVLRACIEQLNADIEFPIAKVGHDGGDQVQRATPRVAHGKRWDVFVCHASEDKQEFVNGLAAELHSRGLNVWYDDFILTVGDGLRRSIDKGLLQSRFGIVVLSPHFFSKQWPQRELDGLAQLEEGGTKVILPVWHKIDKEGVQSHSPTLADRIAVSSSLGVARVANEIQKGMGIPVTQTRGPETAAAEARERLPSNEPPHVAVPAQRDAVVDGHVESAESRAFFRFESLRKQRLRATKADPFAKGYWQATIALQGQIRFVSLSDTLEILRAAKLNLTGWDIGLVPTEPAHAPYPFNDTIECWLAGEGGKGGGRSDFWRAEPIGIFSTFRGYREDEQEYSAQYPNIQFDASIALWRITEVLLYLESFSQRFARQPINANVRFRWTGLENRRLGDGRNPDQTPWERVCRQTAVQTGMNIHDPANLKPRLMNLLQKLSHDLLQAFAFYRASDDDVMRYLYGLYDFNTNTPIQF